MVIHEKPLTSLLSFYCGCVHTQGQTRTAHGWRLIKKEDINTSTVPFALALYAADESLIDFVVVDSDWMRFLYAKTFWLNEREDMKTEKKKKIVVENQLVFSSSSSFFCVFFLFFFVFS